MTEIGKLPYVDAPDPEQLYPPIVATSVSDDSYLDLEEERDIWIRQESCY